MDAKKSKQVNISRVFDAPREVVFAAWSDEAAFAGWYAPKGCSIEVFKFEFKVGGGFHSSVRNPSGFECIVKAVFTEIVANERIAYRLHFADRKGNFVEPKELFGDHADWPSETVVTVDFESVGKQTRMTLHQTVDAEFAERTGALPSWHQMIDRLSERFGFLGREVIVSRLIDAPQELVFRAFTDPEHISNWWGPKGFRTTTHKMDLRTGGRWEYTMHGPDGTDFPNRVQYEEVKRPERLVYSHGGNTPDAEVDFHVTVTFEKFAEKTLLTMRSLFPTQAARDFVIKNYGALQGANDTLNRFQEVLKKLRA